MDLEHCSSKFMQYHTALGKVQCQAKLYERYLDLMLESQPILSRVDFLALLSMNLVTLMLFSVAWFKAVLCHCCCMVILGLVAAVRSFVNHFGEELRVKEPSSAKVILSIRMQHLGEKINT